MKEAVRRRARQLGFELCRFTTAAPPQSAPQFRQWVAGQRHGQMAYLERHADKRTDPQQVLPGARTVVTLAASYAQDEQGTPGSQCGVVARYARYADYHHILGERLRGLAGFIDKLGGEGARSLWYVDTGPLLERDLAQRAGVGFIGKHTNLISRELGNWILLAEILTTLELPA